MDRCAPSRRRAGALSHPTAGRSRSQQTLPTPPSLTSMASRLFPTQITTTKDKRIPGGTKVRVCAALARANATHDVTGEKAFPRAPTA